MSGTVVLGAASDQNRGIVNRSQFGTGAWRARRVTARQREGERR